MDSLHTQFLPSNEPIKAEAGVRDSAWAQPAINPQLCSSPLLAPTLTASERAPIQARGVTTSPEYGQQHGGDYLNYLTPSAVKELGIPTPVPTSSSHSAVVKRVSTRKPTEHWTGNPIVQVDGTESLAHHRTPSHLPHRKSSNLRSPRQRTPYSRPPRHRSPLSTPAGTDTPKASTQLSPEEITKREQKERKRQGEAKRKDALTKIKMLLRCEGVTEEEAIEKGEIGTSLLRVFEVPTAVFASV